MKVKIHNLGGYAVNNYLLETAKGIIAIDTGYQGGMEKFKKRFEKRWPLSQLKYIFLTHHHDDHAGFLHDLLVATEARVILHSLAVQALEEGKNNEPPGVGYPTVLASLLGKLKKILPSPR